jgi:hypothetical protein
MSRRGVTLTLIAILASACAHPPNSFRLIQNNVLVPPGVKDASVVTASVPLPAHRGKPNCPPSPSGLRIAGKRVIVTRDALASATPEELRTWMASLEKADCIGSGESFALTGALIDSLPLPLSRRSSLRGEGLSVRGVTDLTSVNSIKIVSPVFRPGSPAGVTAIEPPTVSPGDRPGSINVELKANPDLTGYEIAWYDIQPRPDGPGFHIVPRAAEVHIGDRVEKETAPRVNRLGVAPDARWFRYFLMTRSSTNQNDYNIVVLSAPTAGELEARTRAFEKDAGAFLQSAAKTSYAAMTPQFGVNPYIRVKMKQAETDLELGATVRTAIEQSAGKGNAVAALAQLTVRKPHNGKLSLVEWDRTKQDILSLPLEGGEEITW